MAEDSSRVAAIEVRLAAIQGEVAEALTLGRAANEAILAIRGDLRSLADGMMGTFRWAIGGVIGLAVAIVILLALGMSGSVRLSGFGGEFQAGQQAPK